MLRQNSPEIHPVILLGMHRSGTSMTARLLMGLSIYMGKFLLENEEALNFQKLNRWMMESVGAHWSCVEPWISSLRSPAFVKQQEAAMRCALFEDPRILNCNFGLVTSLEHQLWRWMYHWNLRHWGWKDPRTTLTFPVWLRIFPNAKFIHIVRNGIDVAISIHRRWKKRSQQGWWVRKTALDYTPEVAEFTWCFQLWEIYLAFLLEHQGQIPRTQYCEIHYEDILKRPQHNLQRIADFLELPIEKARLNEVCAQIKPERLNNVQYAQAYREQIPALISSPIMQCFGYDYSV